MDSITLISRSPFTNGGTERVVYNLCVALKRSGLDAEVLLLVNDADRYIAESTLRAYVADGVPTHIVTRGPNRATLLRSVTSLLCTFWRLPSQIINIHYSTTGSASLSEVIASRLAGKRAVLTFHHPVSLRSSTRSQRIATALSLRLANSVVVDTEYTRKILLNDLPGTAKVKVIPLGVPVPVTGYSQESARSAFGLPITAFVVGYLGRLVSYKGLGIVTRAIALLNDPRFFLLVAGQGPDGAEMQQEATRLLGGRAIFLGPVSDNEMFYRALDVFAMPSSLEGFGLVYVEAALRGIPSVASPTGAVPYVVTHEETGLLVDPTVEGVIGALSRLSIDPGFAKALGQQARRRALEKYTDTAMAENYRDLFDH